MATAAVVPLSTKRALPAKLPMQSRVFDVRATAAAAGTDDSVVPISFSSSNPIKRMSWGGMWWYEVLNHSAKSVNVARLAQGLAVLVNHDPNQRAGILQNGVISDKTGRGDIRFNTTQFGKDIATEVREGTLPYISVGYIVHSEQRVADIDPLDDEDDNYLGTYEADEWEPCEVSLVAIPADPSVGVGRDLNHIPQYPVRVAGIPATPPALPTRSTQENPMPEPIVPAVIPAVVPAAVVTIDHADAIRSERERTVGISLLARQFPEILTRELAEKAINDGSTRDAIATVILEKKREKEALLNAGGQVTLSEKERSGYSFMRAIRAVANTAGGSVPAEASFELDISQTIAKKLGRDTGGLFIPTTEPIFRQTDDELRKRVSVAGSPGSTTGGGATVATNLVSFLDFLRPALRLTALGAEFMGGCSSNFALPKMTGDVGFNWVGENPGADNADVDPTFGQVPFAPLGATASTSWTRQLLIQSSIDFEAKIRNALVMVAAIGIEKAALAGTGGTQPTGVLTTAGVNLKALGTNGANPTKQLYIDMLTAAFVANAEVLGVQKYLVTPEIAGFLAGKPELANTIAIPTFTYGADGQGRINGHDAYWSNLLPKTLVKGTSGAVCHAAIGGSFGALTIAEWGAMEILLDPYTKAKQALVNIIANFLVDSNVTYPQALSVCLDQLAT
jgi:HK97 family phage major capsid protein